MATKMPNILSECDYSPGQISPVALTNWANHKISRAGITPVYDDGSHKWIGMGISRYNGAIVLIGGTFEITDRDLLSTAVREYNEEVGSNMPNVTEAEVGTCYAIQSNDYISIILPVSHRCQDFTPTEELHSILWVTPKQLRIMRSKQNFILYGTTTPSHKKAGARAFAFGSGLADLANPLADAVQLGYVLKPSGEATPFERPHLPHFTTFPRIISDIDILTHDAQRKGPWYHVAYVQTSNYIGLMLQDGTYYTFSIDYFDRIVAILAQRGSPIHTATASEITKKKPGQDILGYLHPPPKQSLMVRSILSMFHRIKSPASAEARIEFEAELKQIRAYDEPRALYWEAVLITKYESLLYRLAYKEGTFFNHTRANFLVGINLINARLGAAPGGMIYGWIIKAVRSHYKGARPPIAIIINIMVNVGLIRQQRHGLHVGYTLV
jgi:hypothetical protein